MRMLPPALILVALLALTMTRFAPSRQPQRAQGDGVFSVAFGDVRSTISAAMVHKADSYFHGGIDMECKEHHDHHDDHDHDHHDDHEHDQSSTPTLLTLGAGSINRSARRKSMCISMARRALS